MNLRKKKDELSNLISSFLTDEANIQELQDFAWTIIDYFSEKPPEQLPPLEDFENVFWHAIWQVQHLCSEDHVKDGSANRGLKETLNYLNFHKPLPKDFFGKRPVSPK